MTDRRNIKRVRKRLRVHFDSKEIKGMGFTADLSETGFRLNSSCRLRPGLRFHGRIVVSNTAMVEFDAEVRWALHIPFALGQQLPNSVGIHFLGAPGDTYRHVLAEATHAAA